MKKFPIEFKQFLDQNKLPLAQLPESIQEKISIFERLYAIEDDKEDGYAQLLTLLDELDIEILEDIEQEYDQILQHNDVLEQAPQMDISSKEEDSDAALLHRLYTEGRRSGLLKSELERLGLKADLSWKTTILGKYKLKQVSCLLYRYDIIPISLSYTQRLT